MVLKKIKKNGYKLALASKFFHRRLGELGCIPNKSLKLKWPSYLKIDCNDFNTRMFILGYFDGDGGIVRDNCGNSWKITICGTADMCNHLKTIFLQFGCKPKILKIRNHYDLRICGLQNTRLFLDWLYKDAVFYMKRKHDIYLKILDFYKTSKRPYRYDTTFIEKIKNVKKMYYVDKISVGDIARKYNCTWSTARGMIDFYSYITI